jgi:glycosyltransferase involved in cell wall biosynthesis
MSSEKQTKILFLGETYRADAQTWINGLKEFGPFDVFTWELEQAGRGIKKVFRFFESIYGVFKLRKLSRQINPELVIAERTTSYGFLAATLHKRYPIAIAQQGITDIYPARNLSAPIKKLIQNYAFSNACLVHAWGEAMTYSMIGSGVDPLKVMILAKGIDLRNYKYNPDIIDDKIRAIVTRSLTNDYRHEVILKAFEKIKNKNIRFELIIAGEGILRKNLEILAHKLNIKKEVVFTGAIPNSEIPSYLSTSDLYISMPCTEGVSSSLFEAFASGCYPIVSEVPGNRAWINDGVNGRLITVDDNETLAKAIEEYYIIRESLRKVLDRNRKTVEEKASFEKNMKIICERYRQLIEREN